MAELEGEHAPGPRNGVARVDDLDGEVGGEIPVDIPLDEIAVRGGEDTDLPGGGEGQIGADKAEHVVRSARHGVDGDHVDLVDRFEIRDPVAAGEGDGAVGKCIIVECVATAAPGQHVGAGPANDVVAVISAIDRVVAAEPPDVVS